MSNVSEHLLATHKAAHAHHTEMIAAHETELEKETNSSFHKTAIASHTKMRDHHATQIADCEKAAASSLEKVAPLPAGLTTLAPARPRVTAVPRHGSPAITANAGADFIKIIGADDESMHSEELSLQK